VGASQSVKCEQNEARCPVSRFDNLQKRDRACGE
jgi:hypothetical protein